MRAALAALLAVAALAGCAARAFQELERPAPGSTKVYVLRPAFSEVGRNESPALYINDREAARLEYQSYTGFTLEPGTYKLTVKPRAAESGVWAGEWTFSFQPGRTYFLAIWNDVEYRERHRGWYLGLPMPYVVTEGQNKSLRSELVAEQDALPVLRTLRQLRPVATGFAPLP